MIQCPRCYNDFNGGANCPRILFACGHTICEKCLAELLDRAAKEQLKDDDGTDRVIYCPECRVIHNHLPVASFPKNLALLNLNKEIKTREESDSGAEKKTSGSLKASTPDKSQKSSDEENVCGGAHSGPCSSKHLGQPIATNCKVYNSANTNESSLCSSHYKKLEAY